MDTEFGIDTLEEALQRHGAPEIFNTDQGAQFASEWSDLNLIQSVILLLLTTTLFLPDRFAA